MSDILNFLRAYPDDAAAVMSKARVAETIAEIERLTAERDALRAERDAERVHHKSIHEMLCKEVDELEAERDELRAELAKRDEVMKEAQEKLQPISALVDMTPSGFPDHDICPIRLGMARDLRELRSRIDAALGGGDEKA